MFFFKKNDDWLMKYLLLFALLFACSLIGFVFLLTNPILQTLEIKLFVACFVYIAISFGIYNNQVNAFMLRFAQTNHYIGLMIISASLLSYLIGWIYSPVLFWGGLVMFAFSTMVASSALKERAKNFRKKESRLKSISSTQSPS